MSDQDRGKRMIEEMVLEEVLDALATITDRAVTEEGVDGFLYTEGSPDFIIGFNGEPLGIELAEIRGTNGVKEYFEEITRIAWKKHDSYKRRGLFRHPIVLLLHSNKTPLFDIKTALAGFTEYRGFEDMGFVEIWAVDLSEVYYTPGHPLRLPDMFCMKPSKWFGFHRIGAQNRKPFG
jgi:hypothetical protein